jgi:hypothetical protein
MTSGKRIHDVHTVKIDEDYLYLVVDGQSYRLRWVDCSPALARATLAQRRHMVIAPSGYGIHWPELDEDLAITPLLQSAQALSAA